MNVTKMNVENILIPYMVNMMNVLWKNARKNKKSDNFINLKIDIVKLIKKANFNRKCFI